MTTHRKLDGNRVYFIVFATDTNDLLLIKHERGDERVYSDSDIKGTIGLGNSIKHIRGYYRHLKDAIDVEDGFVVIDEESNGIQHMRRVVLTHDEEYIPTMALAGVETIGKEKVVQLEVNNKFICVSQPSVNTITFFSAGDLQSIQTVTRTNADIGQSMTLRRKIMPNGIEMHRLYFSQKYQAEGGFASWKVSTMALYLGDLYSYAPAAPPKEDDDAFVFPPKTTDDSVSETISFSVWGESLIAIANQDDYFDLASICMSDQYWQEQTLKDNSFCQDCPSTQASKYSFSFGLQDSSCYTCADLQTAPSDVAKFLLETKSPTCSELATQKPPEVDP